MLGLVFVNSVGQTVVPTPEVMLHYIKQLAPVQTVIFPKGWVEKFPSSELLSLEVDNFCEVGLDPSDVTAFSDGRVVVPVRYPKMHRTVLRGDCVSVNGEVYEAWLRSITGRHTTPKTLIVITDGVVEPNQLDWKMLSMTTEHVSMVAHPI